MSTDPIPTATEARAIGDVPNIPPGLPPADASKPKWALTQDQIDYLLEMVPSVWPAFKAYWPIILMIASGFGIGGAITGRVTAPAPTPSPIVAPAAAGNKIVVYATPAVDTKAILADASLAKVVSIDPVSYQPGSFYPFAGKQIPVPCAAIVNSAGAVLDVQPFSTAADLAQMAKGK